MSSEDDLSSALASLPVSDVSTELSNRIRGRAQVVLEHEKQLARRAGFRQASRVYSRALEPALVACACAVYLYWAFSQAAALLH